MGQSPQCTAHCAVHCAVHSALTFPSPFKIGNSNAAGNLPVAHDPKSTESGLTITNSLSLTTPDVNTDCQKLRPASTIRSMAPKDVYQDEERLTKLLDKLIGSAHNDTFDTSDVADLTKTHVDINFSPRNVREGINTANTFLEQTSICDTLPPLSGDAANVNDVLAAAVTAIVRLSRCCKASHKLRLEAEKSARDAHTTIAKTQRMLEAAKDKLRKRESQLGALQNSMTESESKQKRHLRKVTAECNDVKNRLANAANRENHLSLEAKKREKDFSHLQQRVHTLMSSAKRLSIQPQITLTGALRREPSPRLTREESIESDNHAYAALTQGKENSKAAVILEENDTFRNLLRAIQEEFDDLLLANASLFQERVADAGGEYCEDGNQNDEDIADTTLGSLPEDIKPETPYTGVENTDSEQTVKLKEIVPGEDEDLDLTDGAPAKESELQMEVGSSERTSGELTPLATCARDSSNSDSTNEVENATAIPHDSDDDDFTDTADGTGDFQKLTLEGVMPAPSVEQMKLPFEMIREHFEVSLEQKFNMIRQALGRCL